MRSAASPTPTTTSSTSSTRISESTTVSDSISTVSPLDHPNPSTTTTPLTADLTSSLEAIQDVVHERLQKEGLNKVLLPLNTTDSSQPHTTIFASADIQSKSRIVVIFGEPRQMLGVLALRVLNGPGGVNKGSLVSIVKKLQAQATSATDPSPPGIVLADVGSVFWWPEKRKALTLNAFAEMPLPSMVHNGRRITDDNRIPGSESSEKNVEHMLREVLPALANEKARFDFIGIGRGADILEQQLDQKDLWDCWAKRINTISILGGSIPSSQLHNEELKTFLSKVT